MGISPDHHPVEFARPASTPGGCCGPVDLATAEPDRRVLVAGVVTHRQRPATARGSPVLQPRGRDRTGQRHLLPRGVGAVAPRGPGAPALLVRGRLERVDGVVSVVAEKIVPLDLGPAPVVQGSVTSGSDAAAAQGPTTASGTESSGGRCEILKTLTQEADIRDETFPPSWMLGIGGR